MKTIAIVGTFDSKAEEFQFLKDIIESNGLKTLMIHSGIFPSKLKVDIDNKYIANSIGEDIEIIAKEKNRGKGTEVISKGLEKVIPELYSKGLFDGIISMGGTGGTSMTAPSFRQLPIGVPKVIVSTVAGGDVSFYVKSSDLVMVPSITDVAGLNSISNIIFENAANLISGMVKFKKDNLEDKHKKTIAATMFGLTTPCVEHARKILESKDYEVLVFHATGSGGKSMEKLIEDSHIDAALDITTTEWCDELFGGILNAGEHRLEAAINKGIPEIISLGALDMINFGPVDSLPKNMKNRTMYKHNPTTTLIRTNVEENILLGEKFAEKLNKANREIILLIPTKGFSGLDIKNQEFYNKEADEALINTLKNEINNKFVKIIEMDNHINDEIFAEKAVDELLNLMKGD